MLQHCIVAIAFDVCVDEQMDGEAISVAFATQSGPDCLKDVIPKYGLRLKVYQALKQVLNTQQVA